MTAPRRLVVAITGATGAIFGIRLLERLGEFDVESHLIVSSWGWRTIRHETSYAAEDVRALAAQVHGSNQQGAAISSGSFVTHGMVVAPCSMKTVAAIASGYGEGLVARAADVVLKEQRRLVLMVRESPLSAIHLENMLKLARLGVVVLPPVPAFYNGPATIADVVDHVTTRTLDQLGLESSATPRWTGELSPAGPTPAPDDDAHGADAEE